MSDVEGIAKAIQATAHLGEKGLGVAEKAGGFFAKVFKEPTEEITGMITDKLRFVRWKRLINMADEVDDILEQKGIKETLAVPIKIALPLIEEARIELAVDLLPTGSGRNPHRVNTLSRQRCIFPGAWLLGRRTKKKPGHPIGNPAISTTLRPVVFRPRLTTGLALSGKIS